jgi:hypothetical protein
MTRKTQSARARRSPSPRPKAEQQPNIHVAHTRLEERLKQLEDAFNTNTQVFSDGFKMVEAQLEVARRVAQQLLGMEPNLDTRAKCHLEDDGVTLDWNAYLKEYIEELAAKEEAKVEEKAGPGPILLDSESEQPTIFGGG